MNVSQIYDTGDDVVDLVITVTDGVDAPPDGIAMCQVGGVVNAKRGRGRPWNRFT